MTTENPTCYGKMFDAEIQDCQACQMNVGCHAAMTATAEPSTGADAAPDAITEDIEAAAAEAVAEAEETAATIAAAEELAAAEQPKHKKKAEAKPKADPDTTRTRTALKTAAFIKDDNGKLILLADPTAVTDPDLIVNAGDIVRINNPRSKFNGQDFVISCYSEKYECFRGTQPATKVNADFLPHQIEVIQRAATA